MEQRSLASRFFRYTAKPRNSRHAVLLMVLGWTLALVAGTNPTQSDDTAIHLGFVATIFGGFLAFMGMFAGISRWVAKPAGREAVAEHVQLGEAAHPHFVSRSEWDRKHEELARELDELGRSVAILQGRVARKHPEAP